MVNFTRPINNGDMVRGLNHLVERNLEMLTALDKVDDELAGSDSKRGAIPPLQAMHESHIKRIAGTINVLGGAPAQKAGRHQWVSAGKVLLGRLGNEKSVLAAVHSEECKLKAEYTHTLEQLKSSPEAVGVLRELIQEETQQLEGLESAMGKGQE